MEASAREKVLTNDETEEKQRKSSTRENKNPYFDSSSSDSDTGCEITCEICDKTFSGPKPLRQHERGARHLKRVRKREVERELLGNLGSDSAGSEERELFAVCKTCKKDFTGPESLELHLKSRSHKKKVAAHRLLEEIRDEDGHISLDKLKQKRREKRSQKDVLIVGGKTSGRFSNPNAAAENPGEMGGAWGRTGEAVSPDDSSDDDTISETHEFECLDCKKVFTGVNPWYQHLVSKVHEKTLRQKELFDKLRTAGSSPSGDRYLVQEDDEVISCRLCGVALSGPESARSHLKSRGHAKKLERKKWKKSTRENGEGGRDSSKVKKRAYSEPSAQKSSEMRHEVHETKGGETDQQEDVQTFSKSEELSIARDGSKSVPEANPSPSEQRDASSDASGVRRASDCDELQKQLEVPSAPKDGDSFETTVKADKPDWQLFQETYI